MTWLGGLLIGIALASQVAYWLGYRAGRDRGYRAGLEYGDAGYTIARRRGDHAHIVWRPTRPRAPEGR